MGNHIKKLPGKWSAVCFYCDCCMCGSDLERVSKVREYLYLGSCRAAANFKHLEAEGITHIINTASGMLTKYARNWKERPDEFDYLLVDLVDKSTQKITQSFGPCFEYIEKARNETKGRPPRILIHCVQGKSRSVTIAIAYLMMKEGITVDEALDQIREVRDVVHTPNKGFMKQLYEYEKKLGLSKRSMPYSVQPGAEVSRAPTTTVPNCERRPSKDDLICKQGTEEMRSRSSGEDDKSNGFRSSGCGSLRPESPARSQGNEKASLQNLGIISVSRANRTLSSGRRKIDRLLVQLPRR